MCVCVCECVYEYVRTCFIFVLLVWRLWYTTGKTARVAVTRRNVICPATIVSRSFYCVANSSRLFFFLRYSERNFFYIFLTPVAIGVHLVGSRRTPPRTVIQSKISRRAPPRFFVRFKFRKTRTARRGAARAQNELLRPARFPSKFYVKTIIT